MSDCSTSAFEPKQPRVCGNCKNWHAVGVVRGYCELDETLENGCLPLHLNVDAACGDYEDIPPTLQERYDQLAQVAREMFHEYRELMKDYLWDNGASGSTTKQRRLIVMFHDRLEECGVSVDD